MEPISTKRYVLCLHGFTQNSVVFSKRIKVLSKFLAETYNLETLFPNAPFLLSPQESASQEEKQYGWLYFDESDKMLNNSKIKEIFTNETIKYKGFSVSQATIETFLEKFDNIVAILAFSQGALLATMLLIQACEKKLKYDLLKNLKCCILISGLGKPVPSNAEIEKVKEYAEGIKRIKVPVLIVMGSKDEFITREQTESLKNYFEDSEFWEHEGKHFVPTKKEDLLKYKLFIDKHLL